MKTSIQIQRLTRFLHQKTSLQFSPQLLFQLHSQLITTGLHSRHPFSLLSLLELYYSNPSTLSHATTLFRHIPEPFTTHKWSVAIRSHASFSNPLKALSLFQELLSFNNYRSPVDDDPFVFASVIKACQMLEAFREGKSVHCHVLRLGLDGNLYILNSLVRFYLGFGDGIRYACLLFDGIPEKNIVSVNCMISGWIKRGCFDVGLSLFIEILRGCFGFYVEPNCYTFVILASGCVEYGRVEVGKSFHAYCCKLGLTWNIEISNVLIDLYGKFNCLYYAERLFREMPEKDLFSWNTMLSGYSKNNFTEKAFLLFKEMKYHNLGADRVSFSNLLAVAANSRELSQARMVHAHLGVSGIEASISIGNALINMYLKCGDIETARRIFDDLPNKDIVAWNSMIHGYVECGSGIEALTLFENMQSKGLKADEVTILGLILACRNSNKLGKGIELHSYVESSDYLNNSIVLHNALIDMYAKCGSPIQAKTVFDKMPSRDVVSWTTMIMGYALNGEGEESLATFQRMLGEKIEPDAITFTVVLFACDQAGLVDEGQSLYNVMHEEYQIEPQIMHCEFVVDMLARAGRIEEACQFVRTMPVVPNAAVWRILINACTGYANVDIRVDLVNQIRELNSCCSPEECFISSSKIFAVG